MDEIKSITVLGAGSWGTTLAILLANKGINICLWEKFNEYYDILKNKRENIKFLPGKLFPDNILISNNVLEAMSFSDLIVLAVPSHVLRELILEIKQYFNNKHRFVSVIKGIENTTLFRMSQVAEDVVGKNTFACLSGPTHAEEVANKIPSAIVVASLDQEFSKSVQEIFVTEYLRVYTNEDLIGVELGGSLKNIIAIAAGISDGLNFGDNTKAALLTRGLSEMARLGVVMGAKERTFSGLAGMGDLITTCVSKYSRNRSVGLKLASGRKIKEIVDSMEMVAEGVNTTKSAYELSLKYNVEMPIVEQMYEVLFREKDPKVAVCELMLRKYKSE